MKKGNVAAVLLSFALHFSPALPVLLRPHRNQQGAARVRSLGEGP